MQSSTYLLVLRYAAILGLGLYVVRQVKKPDRFAGRLFAWLMNTSHAPLTDWAFTQLQIPEGATAMGVAASRAHNKQLIAEGRAHVELASVSRLPFADNKSSPLVNI